MEQLYFRRKSDRNTVATPPFAENTVENPVIVQSRPTRPPSKYEHICKGVTTSLKASFSKKNEKINLSKAKKYLKTFLKKKYQQLLNAMRNNELEKLPHCSAEISRCLDDLINMFDGGENDLAEKLQLVRKKFFT